MVFCLGAVPRTELAVGAGLAVEKAIKVDNYLRTSHPHIYAAGYAAIHTDGRITHLWHAAERHGEIAEANVCGAGLKFLNPPFRLKTEVFGRYFFSINWTVNRQKSRVETVQRRSAFMYQNFAFLGGRVSGVVMIDDKTRAELYKRAVLDRWPRRMLDSNLGL